MRPPCLRVERTEFRPRSVRWEAPPAQSTNRLWLGEGGNGPWLLKWYRYPAAGVHPEPEMGRFLSSQGFGGVAAFGARLDRLSASQWQTVAYVQRWVQGTSCWEGALQRLRSGDPAHCWAASLGREVGRMHAILLAPPEDEPAFAVRAYGSAAHLAWVRRVGAVAVELEAALEGPVPAGAVVADWERARGLWLRDGDGWRERLAKLEAIRAEGACCRVHGDLHLGQVLEGFEDAQVSAVGRFVVVDFEGEPLRPLEERRTPDLPLRDVAGMLRSFAYAAAHAGASLGAEEGMQQAFLEAWSGMVPAPSGDWMALLEGLMWEKAIYEALYEIRHRPDWLRIPLAALS